MTLPLPVSDEQLREVHRDLAEPISFETMQRSPALMICLRNLAEIRGRVSRVDQGVMPVERRALPRPSPMRFDGKRAAANDRDE